MTFNSTCALLKDRTYLPRTCTITSNLGWYTNTNNLSFICFLTAFEDDQLDDEDYALIAENTGIQLQRVRAYT